MCLEVAARPGLVESNNWFKIINSSSVQITIDIPQRPTLTLKTMT